MSVTSTTLANAQGKYISAQLIERSELLHRLPQFTNKVQLPSGMGKTAYFTKYNRTDVPVEHLTEGVTPVETAFTISQQSIQVDFWGMYIALTDVAIVTTKDPVLNEALDLVADAIARTKDYNLAEVLNASTSAQFWDGTRASRDDITSTDVFKAAVFDVARADLNDDAAPPSAGDLFVVVCGPQIEADIMADATAVQSFAASASQQKMEAMEKGKVGDWRGFRVIRSNFLPKFTRLTHGFTVTDIVGGSLSGNVYYKITRKSLSRGFEEDISTQTTVAMSNTRLRFAAPATAGYVYNIYAGTVTGDATLFLAKENLAASGTYDLDTAPTSGTNPPETPAASITIHPMYVFAAKSVDEIELNELAMQGKITPKGSSDSDPLEQRRKVGAKYASKAGVRDSTRFKRIELVSTF